MSPIRKTATEDREGCPRDGWHGRKVEADVPEMFMPAVVCVGGWVVGWVCIGACAGAGG